MIKGFSKSQYCGLLLIMEKQKEKEQKGKERERKEEKKEYLIEKCGL